MSLMPAWLRSTGRWLGSIALVTASAGLVYAQGATPNPSSGYLLFSALTAKGLTGNGQTSRLDETFVMNMANGEIADLGRPDALLAQFNETASALATQPSASQIAVTRMGTQSTTFSVPVEPAQIRPTDWSAAGLIAFTGGSPSSGAGATVATAGLLYVLNPQTGEQTLVVGYHPNFSVEWAQWTPKGGLVFSSHEGLYTVTAPYNPADPAAVNYAPAAVVTGVLGDNGRFDLSPDGKEAVWIHGGQVWLGGLSGTPTPTPLTADARAHFGPQFSSNGQMVAYLAGRRLWVVSAQGGTSSLVSAQSGPQGLLLQGGSPAFVTDLQQWVSGADMIHWVHFYPPKGTEGPLISLTAVGPAYAVGTRNGSIVRCASFGAVAKEGHCTQVSYVLQAKAAESVLVLPAKVSEAVFKFTDLSLANMTFRILSKDFGQIGKPVTLAKLPAGMSATAYRQEFKGTHGIYVSLKKGGEVALFVSVGVDTPAEQTAEHHLIAEAIALFRAG